MAFFSATAMMTLLSVLCCGPSFLQLVKAQAQATSTPVRWCIPYNVTDNFAADCSKTVALADSLTQLVTFSCVKGGNAEGCMQMLSNGTADITTFDGGDQYAANRKYGIEPIITEDYGAGKGPVYYAVGVVKKEFCTATTTLADLKGKKSCHTGYGRSAGWNFPVGVLVAQKVAPLLNARDDLSDDAEAVAALFSSVCAPRTSSTGPRTVNGKPTLWQERLCTACAGNCTETDPYYDYAGTFRGVVEGACDVGFTKQETVKDYSKGGKSAQPWSTKAEDEFRLICPTGGCAFINATETCSFAKVPSHAVVASGALAANKALRARVTGAIITASTTTSFLTAAKAFKNQANFLFREDTAALQPVTVTLDTLYGPNTIKAYEGIEAMQKGASAALPSAILSSLVSGTNTSSQAGRKFL